MPEDRGHFNKYNTGTESFFTPGRQLADIAAARPDDPAVIYISLENKESVMSWKQLHELSNRIAWYLLGQGIGPGHSVIAALPIFEHRGLSAEKLLKVTIPESLEYNGAFDEIFDRYLRSVESVGVKTTGMGSMFRLSYRITMKNPGEEKALIDALRTKNGNLEISILPYAQEVGQL